MNKLNPVDVADRFESDITKLVDYYNRSVEALTGTPTEKSDRSLLAEHVFLSAAISFEGALSDLFFAYANIDSSAFVAKKEASIKDHVKKDFGKWYADKIALGTVKHIKASELYPLLDPNGHNITFYDAKKMVDRATKQLIPEHATKYTALNTTHHKLINAAKFIRNCIAHRSASSYEAMMDALVKLNSSNFKGLARSKDKQVSSIGAYLKAAAGPRSELSRLELYLTELKNIVVVLGK